MYFAGSLFTPEVADRADFIFGDEWAVNAMEARRTGREVKHIALAEKRLGTVGVENGSGIDFAGDAERDARGEIGFDEAGDDIDGRPLRREDQVNADGPGHLRKARDGLFDVVGVDHHQVRPVRR